MGSRPGAWRLVLSACFLMLAAVAFAQGTAERTAGTGRLAVVGDVEGVIGPANARHVSHLVSEASERGAEILILRLNTPGGLATSMREIITTLLQAPVPVVGYVAPPGAHAASAGTYILYATDIAAMAPGTNIGAATPVQIGGMPGLPGQDQPSPDQKNPDQGGDSGGAEKTEKEPQEEPASTTGSPKTEKAVNDAVAFIRSLAEMHGRNAEWAEKAVREAATLSAEQAAVEGVINIVAADVPALLSTLDGYTVEI